MFYKKIIIYSKCKLPIKILFLIISVPVHSPYLYGLCMGHVRRFEIIYQCCSYIYGNVLPISRVFVSIYSHNYNNINKIDFYLLHDYLFNLQLRSRENLSGTLWKLHASKICRLGILYQFWSLGNLFHILLSIFVFEWKKCKIIHIA